MIRLTKIPGIWRNGRRYGLKHFKLEPIFCEKNSDRFQIQKKTFQNVHFEPNQFFKQIERCRDSTKAIFFLFFNCCSNRKKQKEKER